MSFPGVSNAPATAGRLTGTTAAVIADPAAAGSPIYACHDFVAFCKVRWSDEYSQ